MYSKTFLKIKCWHLAVFEWTIEYSLSSLSERVCTGIFLGGGAHFVVYAIGGAPLLNSLFYCGSHNEFCSTATALTRSNFAAGSCLPRQCTPLFWSAKKWLLTPSSAYFLYCRLNPCFQESKRLQNISYSRVCRTETPQPDMIVTC